MTIPRRQAYANLRVLPAPLYVANEVVARLHRHSLPTSGHKFSLVAVHANDGLVAGAAIAGRPISRMLDDGFTLEVLRLATDGTPNACSILYAAAARAAKAMGFLKIQTYIMLTEPGTSLKASGWVREYEQPAYLGEWAREDTTKRANDPRIPVPKVRWALTLNPGPIPDLIMPSPSGESLSNPANQLDLLGE